MMNKLVLPVVEWCAYVVASVAIGSIVRVTAVVTPGIDSAPPAASSVVVTQDGGPTPSKPLTRDATNFHAASIRP